jgi:L-threonylcarbamoyladenylate synthase
VVDDATPTLDAAMLREIGRAAALLASGGLVALPTETVYGLGADASNRAAVRRIFAAKRRPVDHPLIVHIASAAQLGDWAAEVPPAAHALAAAFWPGPLTLILRRAQHVPDEVTGGQDTIGLRVPAHPVALALLRAFGGGVAAPSANRFGHVSPTTAAHVRAELGDEVDMVLDGGPCTVGIESTIVDLTAAQPRILRPGGITRAQLEAVLGAALGGHDANSVTAPRVSGALASHYAPETPVRWVERAAGDAAALSAVAASAGSVGVISVVANDALVAHHGMRVEWRALSPEPADYARALYACLRELDELGLDLILLDVPPDTPAWEAVRDRLRRAAGLGQGGSHPG